MHPRGQALRKLVIPAKAGIQRFLIEVDSRFRGNDGADKDGWTMRTEPVRTEPMRTVPMRVEPMRAGGR